MNGPVTFIRGSMNQKLQQELYQKYPELFSQKDLPMTQSLMCFGMEVGDGWFPVLEQACQLIKHHLKNKEFQGYTLIKSDTFYDLNLEGDPEDNKYYIIPEFVQIKEKFGELRIYINSADNYIEGIIDMACAASTFLCETCSKPSKIKSHGGWLSNECKACERKRSRRTARNNAI